jgi:Meiotically Up-regulated Gene 113 (MUG113) protein
MDKHQILDEIRRIALANGGHAPGEKLFCSETGLRKHEWRGKYWARWGDALREAGFEPNKWGEAFDEALLIEKYIELTRELGHIPVEAELLMKANRDSTFPSVAPFKRMGSKAALLKKIRDYCAARASYDDILALCDTLMPQSAKLAPEGREKDTSEDGFVYLMKSGRHYKIGRSVSVGQRERQLKIQLPDRAATLHSIRTDDPIGIEAYWHKRFQAKRKNGEWFELDCADINAFKRRKFM